MYIQCTCAYNICMCVGIGQVCQGSTQQFEEHTKCEESSGNEWEICHQNRYMYIHDGCSVHVHVHAVYTV